MPQVSQSDKRPTQERQVRLDNRYVYPQYKRYISRFYSKCILITNNVQKQLTLYPDNIEDNTQSGTADRNCEHLATTNISSVYLSIHRRKTGLFGC